MLDGDAIALEMATKEIPKDNYNCGHSYLIDPIADGKSEGAFTFLDMIQKRRQD